MNDTADSKYNNLLNIIVEELGALRLEVKRYKESDFNHTTGNNPDSMDVLYGYYLPLIERIHFIFKAHEHYKSNLNLYSSTEINKMLVGERPLAIKAGRNRPFYDRTTYDILYISNEKLRYEKLRLVSHKEHEPCIFHDGGAKYFSVDYSKLPDIDRDTSFREFLGGDLL